MRNRTVDIVLGIAIAAAGVALFVVGVLQFNHIAEMEAMGQVQGLTPKVKLVYGLLGKWGVLGAFGFVGVCVLCSGGEKILNAARAVSKRDQTV